MGFWNDVVGVYREDNEKLKAQKSKQKYFHNSIEVDNFSIGLYVYGLDSEMQRPDIKCSVSNDDFFFYVDHAFRELGQILKTVFPSAVFQENWLRKSLLAISRKLYLKPLTRLA